MGELPGFFTPKQPNADARVEGGFTGVIEILVATFPLDAIIPQYKVELSKEYGREVYALPVLLVDTAENSLTQIEDIQVKFANNQFVFVESKDGQKQVTFRLQPDELLLYPGNYTVRLMQEGRELFKRSLVVHNHPSMP